MASGSKYCLSLLHHVQPRVRVTEPRPAQQHEHSLLLLDLSHQDFTLAGYSAESRTRCARGLEITDEDTSHTDSTDGNAEAADCARKVHDAADAQSNVGHTSGSDQRHDAAAIDSRSSGYRACVEATVACTASATSSMADGGLGIHGGQL
jgi:hypothetical protein